MKYYTLSSPNTANSAARWSWRHGLHDGCPPRVLPPEWSALDMDVYDLAEWCCLGELGALSMDNNSAAVTFPDFTRGHWNDQKGLQPRLCSA